MTIKNALPLLAGAAVMTASAAAPVLAADEDAMWPTIREMLFEDRDIADGSEVVALDAPYRAHDAAVVPIGMRDLTGESEDIQTLYLIVDDNPAPVAAIFHFAPEADDASIETRIRVNEYTNVRAVAETADGRLFMTKAFVKAAGGCAAPGLKDPETAMANLGRMKFKPMSPFEPGAINRAQVMVSHPNYTGMQIDQLTRYWIPPDYVSQIEVSLDGERLFSVEGDIALSEDPAITFSYRPDRPGTLEVEVEDTEGRQFSKAWQVGPTS